jgi:SAM-dependent methyltransferase
MDNYLLKSWRDAVRKTRLEDPRPMWESYAKRKKYDIQTQSAACCYLQAFHLANAQRFSNLFDRATAGLDIEALLGAGHKVRIFDLGCGTGALTQALCSKIRFKENPYIKLIDKSRHALKIAADVCPFPVQKVSASINDVYFPSESGLNIILLGYVLNEMPSTKTLIQKILRLSNQPTLVFILDSAHKESSHRLAELKTQFTDYEFDCLYPCPDNSACPLDAKDWCYSECLWQRPAEIKSTDKLLGIDRSKMSYAGFLYASPEVKPFLRTSNCSQRIIGFPWVKNKSCLLVCKGAKVVKSHEFKEGYLRGDCLGV